MIQLKGEFQNELFRVIAPNCKWSRFLKVLKENQMERRVIDHKTYINENDVDRLMGLLVDSGLGVNKRRKILT